MKFLYLAIFLIFIAAAASLAWYVHRNNRHQNNEIKTSMNEATAYILRSIETQVWSGFHTRDEVEESLKDLLEDDEEADEKFLRKVIQSEFEKKSAAEKSWPVTTDCDKLDRAFAQLDSTGIIALQNTGYTMSDGLGDVSEILESRNREQVKGYCFYHGQDLERAVDGAGLMIAFGSFDDDKNNKIEVGSRVKEILQNAGLNVEWNGDPDTRMNITKLDWKRRGKK